MDSFKRYLFNIIIALLLYTACVQFNAVYAANNLSLKYSTYLNIDANSLNSFDIIDMVVDEDDNIYIAGTTSSNVPNNHYISGGFGDPDYYFTQGFVFKYSSNYTLIYTAYLQDADIRGITVDAFGHIYITGNKSGNTYTPYCGFGTFVAKLSVDGSSVDYCIIVAPNYGSVTPHDIAVDMTGNTYITGEDFSVTGQIPTTNGVIQQSPIGLRDVFIIKLSSDGSQVLMATYLGGSENDYGQAISLDSGNNIIVTGQTESNDFIGIDQLKGASDAYVIIVNNDGTNIINSKIIGGTNLDGATNLVLDKQENILLSINTLSDDFPVTSNAYQTILGGGIDSAVVKLTNNLQILFSTYIGGPYDSNIVDIDIDSANNVYATGLINGPLFPTTQHAFQEIFPPSVLSSYLIKLDAGGSSLLYSTYIGSGNHYFYIDGKLLYNVSSSIKLNSKGEINIIGYTNADAFPVTNDASLKTLPGMGSLFFSTFNLSPLEITTPRFIDEVIPNNSYEFTFNVSGGIPPYEWFIEPKYLPVGINLFDNGVMIGIPTTLLDYDMLYDYSIPLLPMIIGVKDQNGSLSYKEFLAPYSYSQPEELTTEPPAAPPEESTISNTDNSGSGAIDYYFLLGILISILFIRGIEKGNKWGHP